jgi:hypothetical protein
VKWSQNTLIVGFLLIIIGIALLTLSSGNVENSVFFIFPFFFFSGSDPIGILFALAFALILLIVVIRSTSFFSSSFENERRDQYLKVGAICAYCGEPMPSNSAFCPSCGNPVDYETSSNQ